MVVGYSCPKVILSSAPLTTLQIVRRLHGAPGIKSDTTHMSTLRTRTLYKGESLTAAAAAAARGIQMPEQIDSDAITTK